MPVSSPSNIIRFVKTFMHCHDLFVCYRHKSDQIRESAGPIQRRHRSLKTSNPSCQAHKRLLSSPVSLSALAIAHGSPYVICVFAVRSIWCYSTTFANSGSLALIALRATSFRRTGGAIGDSSINGVNRNHVSSKGGTCSDSHFVAPTTREPGARVFRTVRWTGDIDICFYAGA